MTSTPDSIEGTIIIAVRWVKLGVEVFGAVAVIRTGLNFFLSMEMKGERTVEKREAAQTAHSPAAEL